MAFSRKASGDHMRVMRPDDLPDPAIGFICIIRAQLPDDLASLLRNDRQNIGLPAVPNDIVRMEAFIARIIPLIGAQDTHAVDMHPVKAALILGSAASNGIFGNIAELIFAEMLMTIPPPDDLTLPIDLYDAVVDQRF